MPNETLIERIDDLFPQHELWVHCEACRHSLKQDKAPRDIRHYALGRRSPRPGCDAKGFKVLIVWDC